MADPSRPAFRPQRARASLSALPASTNPTFLTGAAKENGIHQSTTTLSASPTTDGTLQKRKKRAQSLGGEALEGARKRLKEREQDSTATLELLPGREERRKAAPRRSILKQTPSLFGGDNHTISFPPSHRASFAGPGSDRLSLGGASGAHTTDFGSLPQLTKRDFSKATVEANTASNSLSHASAARRRSSLRPRTSTASAGGASAYDDSDASDMEMEEEEDPNGSMDMDVTRFETTALYDGEGRRKSIASHSRRVSFAANAHIRTYTPDKPTADAQAFAAEQARLAALAASAGGDDSFSSTSSAAFSDDAEGVEADDDNLHRDEPSMEISREMLEEGNSSSVKLRFGGHFAGTNVPAGALSDLLTGSSGVEGGGENDDASSSSSSSGADNDEDGTQAMEEVTADVVTSAFNQPMYETGVFNSQAVHERAQQQEKEEGQQQAEGSIYPSLASLTSTTTTVISASIDVAQPQQRLHLFSAPSLSASTTSTLAGGDEPNAAPSARARFGPRPSVAARQANEDDEDEAIMRELGFAKGGKPRQSRAGARISFAGSAVTVEEDEEDGEEMSMEQDEEDGTGAMEMTTAVGGLISASSQPLSDVTEAQEDNADEDEVDSDAEVSMQLTSHFGGDRTVDMSFATEAAPRSEASFDVGEGDATATMQMDDATGAMVEATTYGGILSQSLLSRPDPAAPAPAAAEQNIFRASLPPPGRRSRSPSKSPAPQVSPHKSPRSPYRRRTLPRGTSPLPSPRRVSVVAPPAPAVVEEEKPVEVEQPKEDAPAPAPAGSPIKHHAPPSSLAVPPPPKSPRLGRLSVSPAPAPGPGSPITARSSARARSRSRSRSASPVKQSSQPQQQPQGLATPAKAIFNPRTLAPPQSAGRSPGGSLSLRALLAADSPAAKDKRISQLQLAEGGEQGEELNLTGSEFDSSFEGGAPIEPTPASLDAFFSATGVSFVDDILDLAGVDLAGGRRKSVAPGPGAGRDEEEREPAGPPGFADMAVAGACKSLFYQLYQSDQLRLQEGIHEAQQIYTAHEEAIAAAHQNGGDKPRVFKDWAGAGEEAKGIMKSQFRQIKLYYLLQGQLEWKECRAENYQQIIEVMEQNLEGLREDRAKLAEVDISSVILSLEERHAALQADLLAERKLDAELSSYSPEDVEYLQALHADAEEQDEQLTGNPAKNLPGRRPELDRIEQQLQSYRDTLDKYSSEEARLQSEIADLEERRRDKRTKADLVRLQAEYEALQRVQGWELVHFSREEVRMRHWGEFEVAFALVEGSLKARAVQFELQLDGGKAAGGLRDQVTAFLLAKIRDEVERVLAEQGEKDVRSLLRLISSRSTILRHIRHEVALTSLRFPTTARLITSTSSSADPILELDIDVFCARSRRGFAVVIPLTVAEVVDAASVDDWARSISASVKPRFGKEVNALALAQTVNDRLEGGDGRGALVDAVMAAEEECDHAF